MKLPPVNTLLLAVIAVAVVTAGGFLLPKVSGVALTEESEEEVVKRVVIAKVRDTLLDPDSGKFDGVVVRKRKAADISADAVTKNFLGPEFYCVGGLVNAKNRLGGYVGRTPFVALVQPSRKRQVIKEETGKDPGPDMAWFVLSAETGRRATTPNTTGDCGFSIE